MPGEKYEKIKLYLVVGLACVAAVVAYFRFVHEKKAPGPAPEEVPVAAPHTPTVYPIRQDRLASARLGGSAGQSDQAGDLARVRDIFAVPDIPLEPLKPAKPPTSQASAGAAMNPESIDLQLKGTIIAGDRSMAIINGKFIRQGETIDIFTVTRILENEATLKAGTYERTLKVLNLHKGLSN